MRLGTFLQYNRVITRKHQLVGRSTIVSTPAGKKQHETGFVHFCTPAPYSVRAHKQQSCAVP